MAVGKLAVHGGAKIVPERIERFKTIDQEESIEIENVLRSIHPLSGYLGGIDRGGYFVERLESEWAKNFRTSWATAVNSATSGLLAAAHAIDMRPGDEFIVSPYTMSATVAAPMFLGGVPVFCDIEPDTFCLNPLEVAKKITKATKAVFVTNLFGHPGHLTDLRKLCNKHDIFLVEDAAQSPFAVEGNKLAGTHGHIGVFSLNVHKHLQCGEGGICVTDSDLLDQRMRDFRNHSELFDGGAIGLNLRMTEVTAAISTAQLRKAKRIITGRIEQAKSLTQSILSLEDMGELSGVTPPAVRSGCAHVYYVWAAKIDYKKTGMTNHQFMEVAKHEFLEKEGACPLSAGYVNPLYRLKAFEKYRSSCPVAEEMHDKSLVVFENCGWSPTLVQINQIARVFEKVLGP